MNQPMTTSNDATRTVTEAARNQAARWNAAYRRRVLIVDIVVLVVTGLIAEWIGGQFGRLHVATLATATVFSVGVAVLWILVLTNVDSRDLSLVGQESEEYRRVAAATGWTYAITAAFEIFLNMPISRAHFAATFLLGFVGLVAGRFLLRSDIRRRRRRDEYISRVVVVGLLDAVGTLCEYFARSPSAGYRVVGLCIPDAVDRIGEEVTTAAGTVPILGYRNHAELESIVQSAGADTLALVFSGKLGPERVQDLTWRMQAINTALVVVPGLTELANHRLLSRPLENLPLVVIDAPTHDVASMATKRVFDILLSLLGLVVALPVMALAGLAIKLDDRGPVFYRQKRVGLDGEPFDIIKLRSMKVGTDATPQAEQHRHGSMFHKRTSDTCVTPVGKVLRATSIDELPQLFNVIGGSMSLVGPRPLAVGEAKTNSAFLEHRAHVKPGMTGLWQVSGRSDLDDKDRVRLDESYAANWSVMGDVVIIWRTLGAVLKRKGAY